MSSMSSIEKGLNSLHLSMGSQCPKIDSSKVTLYNMRFCPFAHRTVLVLCAKKIPFDVVNINLKSKPDWFLEKNSLGKVPVIEKDGLILGESLVTSDYLDEKYPENKLHPDNLEQKAQDRFWVEKFSQCVAMIYFKLGRGVNENELNEVKKELHKGLDTFDKELEKRKSKFFCGNDRPGMLDYMIWPWFERMQATPIANIDIHSHQKLGLWFDEMMSDDAVKACVISKKDHQTYMTARLTMRHDFDMLHKK